MELFKIILNN